MAIEGYKICIHLKKLVKKFLPPKIGFVSQFLQMDYFMSFPTKKWIKIIIFYNNNYYKLIWYFTTKKINSKKKLKKKMKLDLNFCLNDPSKTRSYPGSRKSLHQADQI